MIKVRGTFSGWHTVSYNKALEFARFLYKGITTMNDDKRLTYINTKKVKGVVFTKQELKVN